MDDHEATFAGAVMLRGMGRDDLADQEWDAAEAEFRKQNPDKRPPVKPWSLGTLPAGIRPRP